MPNVYPHNNLRTSLDDDSNDSQSKEDEEDSGTKSRGSSRSRLFRNRTRFNLNRAGTSTTENPQPQTNRPLSVTKNLLRGRDRFRNLLNRTPNSTLSSSSPSFTDQTSTA